ncbi:MAG: hypothetical protein ACYC6L_10445 [Anaerolineae bacterium]
MFARQPANTPQQASGTGTPGRVRQACNVNRRCSRRVGRAEAEREIGQHRQLQDACAAVGGLLVGNDPAPGGLAEARSSSVHTSCAGTRGRIGRLPGLRVTHRV